MTRLYLLFLITILMTAFDALPLRAQQHPIVIFDTDMGPDYDDVGAIAALHAMADSGECTVLATIASNRSPYVAAVLNVLNTYFGRPSLPIGVVQGPALQIPAKQKWDSLLVASYPHTIRTNADAENAVTLYRRLLAAQPDTSVTIITVGFFTNMSNLLQSQADSYSSLNGKELVQRKVKRLVSMAGRFDQQIGKFKEFNVMQDAAASVLTFREWPRPILFSGFEIGWRIHTGLPIMNSSIQHSPVKDVFATSIPLDPNDKAGRMSWDETAVLVAIRGADKYFSVVHGIITGNADGTHGWNTAGTRDAYLVEKLPATEVEKVIDDLIMHQPVRR